MQMQNLTQLPQLQLSLDADSPTIEITSWYYS